MSNFDGYPQFCFGYLSQYAVVMSVDDAYYRKMFGSNDYFRHWAPSDSNCTSPVHQNYLPVRPNFHPSMNNNNYYSGTDFSKNCQPFRKAASNSDQVMPAVRNGPKVQANTYVKPSNYGNKKQEVVINSDVYEKSNVVFFNGQGSQLAASKSQVIHNGQSVYYPGYAAENQYRSSFTAKSANNNNLISSPISNCVPVDRNVYRSCSFCRQNGDRPEFFESHPLKDSSGNVVCPVLRAYVCDICGATGSKAHTRTYCPVLKSSAQKPLKSAVCLKNTLRNSSGCIRKQFLKQ